jgi:hypothetical protein
MLKRSLVLGLSIVLLSAAKSNAEAYCADATMPGTKYSVLAPNLKVYPPKSDVPWSKALIIRDETGRAEMLIVRDHYNEKNVAANMQGGAMSSWGLGWVHFSVYGVYKGKSLLMSAKSAVIKVGDKRFPLEIKTLSTFVITPELGQALPTGDPVMVRLGLDEGHTATFPIGDGTVKEWAAMSALICQKKH